MVAAIKEVEAEVVAAKAWENSEKLFHGGK